MPDTTPVPTPATDSALLGAEATGIYAPARFIHATPHQRYEGYAGLIILAHALLFALASRLYVGCSGNILSRNARHHRG